MAGKPAKPQAFVTAAGETMANRRIDIRYPREAIPEITGLTVSGDEATLVNISASGLLMESATRYAPGRQIIVAFEGKFPIKKIKGRIVRCHVSAINAKRKLLYHIAVVFDARLVLHGDAETTPAKAEERASAAEPVNRW